MWVQLGRMRYTHVTTVTFYRIIFGDLTLYMSEAKGTQLHVFTP